MGKPRVQRLHLSHDCTVFRQRIEYVDMPPLSHGVREAQRSVTKTAARVDHVIARLGFDFHSFTLEVILAIQERPRDVLLPALDSNVTITWNQKYRERPERPYSFGIFHSPA